MKSHRPLKRWGQHFFRDQSLLRDLVERMTLSPHDVVLEIGPGQGILTEILLEKVKQVIAIEIDPELYQNLVSRFSKALHLTLIQGNFLEWPMDNLFQAKPKVVANIPYYITTPILMKLLNEPTFKTGVISPDTVLFSDIFIMVQKEVADRILACPGNKQYGLLTLAINYAAAVFPLAEIDRSFFYPVPKVDSFMIHLQPHLHPPVHLSHPEVFWQLAQAIFQSRRKTLRNSLKRMGVRADVLEMLDTIDLQIRGETLDLEQLAHLANHLVLYSDRSV